MVLRNPVLLAPFSVGAILLAINLYGLGVELRIAESVPPAHVRFKEDLTLPKNEVFRQIRKLPGESTHAFAVRLTRVINDGILHFDNWDQGDPDTYHQRVPIHENFILHLLGYLPGYPQFERYHFVDYRRSIERGIGLCGDHAMILSQILDEYRIPNKIYSFTRGHVIVEAEIDDEHYLLDADFGVAHQERVSNMTGNPDSLIERYSERGYGADDIYLLSEVYSGDFWRCDSVYECMPRRYVFEPLSYFLKWAIPLGLLLIAGWCFVVGERREIEAGNRSGVSGQEEA